jgi:methyl-accepting chemotaxis protein
MKKITSQISNCSLRKRLLLAFIFVIIVILFLAVTARIAMDKSEEAVTSILDGIKLYRLVNNGNVNLAKAGQMPHRIGAATSDLLIITRELELLEKEFSEISQEIHGLNLSDDGNSLARNFTDSGKQFYLSLNNFLPIRENMLSFYSVYKGKLRPLPDIITERELGHVKFIKGITRAVENNKPITGGTDYRVCGFYQWYTKNPIKNEEVREIFEEIDPLHQKLHNFAAQIKKLLDSGEREEAKNILVYAEKDLELLGRYFTGVRQFATEKHIEAEKEFEKQFKLTTRIYGETSSFALGMDEYIAVTILNTARKNVQAIAQKSKKITFYASVVGLSLALIIGIGTSSSISNQLRKLYTMLEDIAEGEGDLTRRLEIKADNEMGKVAKWFNLFVSKLQKMFLDIITNIAVLNETAVNMSSLAGRLSTGADRVANKSDKTSKITQEISARMNEISIASDSMSSDMDHLSSNAEHASENLELIDKGTRETNESMLRISEKTNTASTVTSEAVASAIMVQNRIDDLTKAAHGIDKVVEIIIEISGRTKLLALNATIEASRAGEAGKGFSVVAKEVKELALQTNEAIIDIQERVEAIKNSSSGTTSDINMIVEIMNNINDIVETIGGSVNDQTATTQNMSEQIVVTVEDLKKVIGSIRTINSSALGVSDNVNNAAASIQVISEEVSHINQDIENMKEFSHQVNDAAAEVNETTGKLDVMVNRFKA